MNKVYCCMFSWMGNALLCVFRLSESKLSKFYIQGGPKNKLFLKVCNLCI